ncbi:hypothetical protein [Paenisporosarcina cavernae]|nr:hypothetical protein [Paenisporosarcina cavernae]
MMKRIENYLFVEPLSKTERRFFLIAAIILVLILYSQISIFIENL